jgi:hypothetical protein
MTVMYACAFVLKHDIILILYAKVCYNVDVTVRYKCCKRQRRQHGMQGMERSLQEYGHSEL